MNANQAIPAVLAENRAKTRLILGAIAILFLWAVYTAIEALNQAGQLHPVLATLLEFIPGLFGIGLLLASGLTIDDCFLKFAPLSKQGLTVFFLLTPLCAPILLSATWSGWHPVNALILNPLSAVSQELFFRCTLLPVLLMLFPRRPNLAIILHVVFFGLWHTGPLVNGAPVYGVVVVMLIPALFGIGWGWQTWRDKTVSWVMVYHILLLFIQSFYTWGS